MLNLSSLLASAEFYLWVFASLYSQFEMKEVKTTPSWYLLTLSSCSPQYLSSIVITIQPSLIGAEFSVLHYIPRYLLRAWVHVRPHVCLPKPWCNLKHRETLIFKGKSILLHIGFHCHELLYIQSNDLLPDLLLVILLPWSTGLRSPGIVMLVPDLF